MRAPPRKSYPHTMKRNRQHLIPTPRTDKNGRTTTRHMKPATESNIKVPNPTPPTTRKRRKQLEQETATALTQHNPSSPTTEADPASRARSYQRLLEILPQYTNETLQRFNETAPTDICWKLNNLLIEATPTEDYIKDWLTIEPITKDQPINAELIVNALEKYKHLTPQKRGHYPIRRTQQVNAITRVTQHFGTMGEGLTFDTTKNQALMKVIEDEQLRELLTTHEDPIAIADLIVTRNVIDPEQIAVLYEELGNTPNAINDGIL